MKKESLIKSLSLPPSLPPFLSLSFSPPSFLLSFSLSLSSLDPISWLTYRTLCNILKMDNKDAAKMS